MLNLYWNFNIWNLSSNVLEFNMKLYNNQINMLQYYYVPYMYTCVDYIGYNLKYKGYLYNLSKNIKCN